MSLHSDFLKKLENAIHEQGIHISGEIRCIPDKFQRFKDARYPWKGKSCYVKISSRADGALFGDWRQDIHQRWYEHTWKELSTEEKKRRKFEVEQEKKRVSFDQEEATDNCKITFNLSDPLRASHPYLLRKRIVPYGGVRQYAEMIVLPLYNHLGELKTLQYIYEDGFKKFHAGAPVKGNFLILGNEITNTLRICEGWSTGCSIHEHSKDTVVVAFSKSNMLAVASSFKKMLPNHKLIVCADNDHSQDVNYGLKMALLIKKTLGIPVCYPDFSAYPNNNHLSDFNDLANVAGVTEMQRQLLNIE